MNELFLKRMKEYIPNEMDVYLESLSKPLFRGLRVNRKKISFEKIKDVMHLENSSIFSKDAFYVEQPLGNHPYHICGAFYLQEPSASSAVEVLDVQEDDYVLDLCAAPGSKSTQIASKLGKDGFIVSNEFDDKRALILLSNMERMGVMNMAVTNSTVDKICQQFQGLFDKVLVDAPCSGEGMMKKHEIAKEQWSLENVLYCAKRQKEILKEAYKAIKPEGILVYSTCTYAREENEDVVEWFLSTFEDMELVEIEDDFGREGLIKGVKRIFPMDHGEGHFIAKFKKKAGSVSKLPCLKSIVPDRIVLDFLKDQIEMDDFYYHVFKNKVYLMRQKFLDFKNIKVLRQGIYVGDIIKNRFEPAHAFYMCSDFKFKNTVDVSIEQMDDFMHGLEIDTDHEKGYVGVCFDGICFGFGKSDSKRIKNKIPKGLRLLPNSHIMTIKEE